MVAGKRYFEHATSSNAYIQAVREERVRRVHLTDGGHSWCVYTFVVFEDAAMWLACRFARFGRWLARRGRG